MQPHPIATPPGAYTAFDLLLLAIILISTFLAWRKGFIRVLFSLGGLVAGFVAATWYFRELAQELHAFITDLRLAEILAFLAIAGFVIAAFTIVGGVIRKAFHAVGLGIVDNLLGAAIGFFRGVVFAILAVMALSVFFPKEAWMQNSQLSPYFLRGESAVSFVVPDDFRQQMANGARILLHETPELLRPHTLEQHM